MLETCDFVISSGQIALAATAIVGTLFLLHWLSWGTLRLTVRAAQRIPPELWGLRAQIHDHPFRARFMARFPRFYGFLEARLTPRPFTGLPLTLLALGACYFAALFGGLVEDVLTGDRIVGVDTTINNALACWRTPTLLVIFHWITGLAASPALCAVALAVTGLLWGNQRGAFIIPLWITFLGSQATSYISKYALGRPRPELLEAAVALTPSFPSGHTTGAAAVYGFLAYAITRDFPPGGRPQFEVAFWAMILISFIGFSRLFLSQHYLSDVVAGLLVGGFWLLVGFALSEWIRGRAMPPGLSCC